MGNAIPLTGLSQTEILLLAGLLALFLIELLRAYGHRQWWQLFRPTLFVAGILSYYAVVSPLYLVFHGDTITRGTDLRSAMVWGWGGALVFYLCVLLGFYEFGAPRFMNRFLPEAYPERLHRLGSAICWLGMGIYGLAQGERLLVQLNPFTAREQFAQGGVAGGVNLGAAAGIGIHGVNLLIPGVLLLFTAWVISRRHQRQLLAWILATMGLFTTLGFRWRLVVLVVPMAFLWFLVRRRRPSLRVLLALAAVLVVVVSGIIGIGRDYGGGLDVEAIQEQSFDDYVQQGMEEGKTVFLTTSGVIRDIPELGPFVGPAPIVALLSIPIPRFFWPEKDTIGYLLRSIQPVFGDPVYSAGAAILNYGEYYLIAGWPSLIAMSLLMGWLLRCQWNWFVVRREEPMAQVIYILSVSFLYVVISRGHLPQLFLLGTFTLLPLYWIYGRWARPLALRPLQPEPGLPDAGLTQAALPEPQPDR